MNKKILFLITILFTFNTIYTIENDNTSDIPIQKKQYGTLTDNENPYKVFNPFKYGIDDEYISRIKRIRNPYIFNNEVDLHNITLNTNISSYFPFTFVPFGGVNLTFDNSVKNASRGIDIGFFYKMETLLDGLASFSVLNSYTNTGSFLTFSQFDFYPDLIKNRKTRIYANTSLSTTAPQYYFLKGFFAPKGEYISKIFKRLNFDQTDYSRTGFTFGAGFEIDLPFKDIVTDTGLRINYDFTESKLIDPYSGVYPTKEENINASRLSIDVLESITFSMQKQNKVLLTGELLRFYGVAKFPLLSKDYNFIPELSFKINNIYSRKIYKDFAFKSRFIAGLNYNTRENLSGDGMVRGLNRGDFTGFAYLIANIDALLPMVYINLNSAADITLKEKVNFIIYFALFIDGGVSLSNDNLKLNNLDLTLNNNYLTDFRISIPESDNYLIYSFTAGGGVRIYPYFLHFIVRIDVGVNLLDAILNKKSPNIELTISLNDVY